MCYRPEQLCTRRMADDGVEGQLGFESYSRGRWEENREKRRSNGITGPPSLFTSKREIGNEKNDRIDWYMLWTCCHDYWQVESSDNSFFSPVNSTVDKYWPFFARRVTFRARYPTNNINPLWVDLKCVQQLKTLLLYCCCSNKRITNCFQCPSSRVE